MFLFFVFVVPGCLHSLQKSPAKSLSIGNTGRSLTTYFHRLGAWSGREDISGWAVLSLRSCRVVLFGFEQIGRNIRATRKSGGTGGGKLHPFPGVWMAECEVRGMQQVARHRSERGEMRRPGFPVLKCRLERVGLLGEVRGEEHCKTHALPNTHSFGIILYSFTLSIVRLYSFFQTSGKPGRGASPFVKARKAVSVCPYSLSPRMGCPMARAWARIWWVRPGKRKRTK